MQEVISVVYCKEGALDHVRSFIINDSKNENERLKVIELCEQCFISYIKENPTGSTNTIEYTQFEIDQFLDYGHFSHNGIDIYISWSL